MKATNEIIIIGGGIIGLSCAIELNLRGASVTVISKDFQQASIHAAAGMLAPGAEAIQPKAMADLAFKSRWLYPEWIRKLEDITGMNLEYWPCGILAPVYEKSNLENPKTGTWLDSQTIGLYQKGLGKDVIGGWWYPEDGQVNTKLLAKGLLQAAETLGINLLEKVSVEAISQRNGYVSSIFTSRGEMDAQHYILTTGAWANQLLPLPVRPVKGQMLSVKMPKKDGEPFPIQRVLFGDKTYLVPRRNGKLIVGATSEEVNWNTSNTTAGIKTLLHRAIRLFPEIESWPIEEFWMGFRPTTPDELPILGQSNCYNLHLATGHYRNGILLAPVTASIMADLVLEEKEDPLLSHFRYDRNYYPPAMNHSQKSNNHNGNGKISHYNIREIIPTIEENTNDSLIIAGRKFKSRLMTGTGKYPNIESMQQSVAASGCQIVTVAVRRVQTKAPGHEGLAEALNWGKIWMLPNTAGCKTAEEAIRVARLGREMAKLLGQEDNNFVKLEVIPDSKYLLPDPIGTLKAAEQLVKEGFAVLPYINADPMLAKHLEEAGCATVMPLGAPIGSGQGIKTEANIRIIIDEAKIPVVIDAGIGSPSEASYGMEMGADALLVNSAIALAQNPVAMATAMGMATIAGRLSYLSGRIPIKNYASASSPLTGVIK